MASHLGKTISELDISWDEFMYWMAYFQVEPPEEPANYRNAALMAQITNMSGRSLRDGKSVTAEDFFAKKPQSMESQIAFFKSLSQEDK